MKPFALCLLGFGNVNRTLVELLQRKNTELRERYGIQWRITGVGSRRIGWRANAAGFDVDELVRPPSLDAFTEMRGQECVSYNAWLDAAQPDVVFEATSLNVETGQPAIDHIRGALEHGAHAITANKGPVVHAYEELRDLAARRGKQFLFESTVMDGVPIFSLFRHTLPAIEVRGFKGILNSTTNVILTGMERGLSFDESLGQAQQLGVAETDASMCRAQRTDSGVTASVRPEKIPLTDPMALVDGTSSIIQFETDIFPGLTITEENPGMYATAYGMLADFIRAAHS